MNKKWFPYVILAPGLILFVIFTGIPIFYTLLGSITYNGTTELLSNVITLLEDSLLLKSIWNTIIILALYLLMKIPIAFLLAYFISKLSKIERFVLTIIFIPTTIGNFAYGVIFRFLFSNNGFVSSFFQSMGFSVEFLSNPFLSKLVIAIALFVSSFGTMTLFLLLAIKNNISKDLVDLSEIDGIGVIDKFKKIYIPLLKPLISLFVLFSVIETVALIELPMQLTQGGPNNSTITIGYYIYNQAIKYGHFSYATFISLLISLILIAILLSSRSFKQRGYVYEER